MRQSSIGLALVGLILLHGSARPCPVFLAARGKVVLAGNNEDWIDKKTRITFRPADGESFGRVDFGFGNGVPQGGLNDHG